MEVILFVCTLLYCIYLNVRLREALSEIEYLFDDINNLEAVLNSKIRNARNETKVIKSQIIKDLIKPKKIAKPGRRGSKKRGKLS
jgi:ElaB/YqjD/DUF883 family membrane-anchored ribosome-binding protein